MNDHEMKYFKIKLNVFPRLCQQGCVCTCKFMCVCIECLFEIEESYTYSLCLVAMYIKISCTSRWL